ncbi:MAG: M23 family metallopeptidase [Bacillota bacterium]
MGRKAIVLCLIILVTVFLTNYSGSYIETMGKKREGNRELTPVLHLSTLEVCPGDYLVIYVENVNRDDHIALSTGLLQNPPGFTHYKRGQVALAAVNYRTAAGKYFLYISISRKGQVVWEKREMITVLPKKFLTQNLKVTRQQQAIRNEKLWKEDSAFIEKAKSVSAPEPLWQGKFLQPVEGRISTEYGVIRYINNVESGRHAGIDIAARKGTPVKATNRGMVTLSMPLHLTGNTIIIDHGMDIFSAYSHLDRLLVKEGQLVEKGDIIGEIGSTGFSTGPHLHWTISIGPVFTNPWRLLESDPLEWIK